MNFIQYRMIREDIVSKVYQGIIVPNVDYNSSLIDLGYLCPTISLGGNEIIVNEYDNKKYVFFFTFRGILDNYSGFLYVPKEGYPQKFEDLYEKESTQIISFGDNWYYCSHH